MNAPHTHDRPAPTDIVVVPKPDRRRRRVHVAHRRRAADRARAPLSVSDAPPAEPTDAGQSLRMSA